MRSPNGVRSFPDAARPGGRRPGWLARTGRTAGLALFVFGVLSLTMGISPAHAGSEEAVWTVTEVSGDVQYRPGGGGASAWRALRDGDVVGAATELRSGSDGRAVLSHRTTTMTMTPDSRMALPEAAAPGQTYRVFQSVGTLLYRIKERAASLAVFEVETPYLAAIVKGTVFTVNASAEGAFVHLTEGIVEVNPMLGGDGATLAVGQTARITAMPGAKMMIEGGVNKSPNAAPGRIRRDERKAKSDAKAKSGKGSVRVRSLAGEADVETDVDEKKGPDGGKTGAGTGGKGKKVEGKKVKIAKAVVIRNGATSVAAIRANHPKAVAIFTRNSGDGIFARGTTVATAFEGDDAEDGDHAKAKTSGRGSHAAKAPKLKKDKAAKVKEPNTKAANVKAPKVKAPKVKVSKVKAPKIKAPKIKVSKIKVPKIKAPKVDGAITIGGVSGGISVGNLGGGGPALGADNGGGVGADSGGGLGADSGGGLALGANSGGGLGGGLADAGSGLGGGNDGTLGSDTGVDNGSTKKGKKDKKGKKGK